MTLINSDCLMLLNIVESQKVAAGTVLLYTSIPVTLGAAYYYYTKGDIDLKIAGLLIPTVFIFACPVNGIASVIFCFEFG